MTPTTNNGNRDPGSGNHRSEAEAALAHAQRNPVLSAEQSFLSAQVHALLALEARLGEIVVALRDANIAAPLAEPRPRGMARPARARDGAARRGRAVNAWEYLISALPRFEAPTQSARSSAAVQALNELGGDGWEAVGMTVLNDETVAVLLKRPASDEYATPARR